MSWTQIADNYFVSPQITLADVEEASRQGFDTIICNRPDAEDPGQPTFEEISAAATRAGMACIHIPMVNINISSAQVEALKPIVAEDKKVLAYCRSGRRSAVLFEATTQG
ncbi:TIGR01244 family sulfur transferase [Reinekea thalattae]|uniref:TIGR01244 family phosphatase n=1 Tax=Reinekea thalattae TaxID=2593301 RepID=A0A5C8Z8W3_9GAMM|nr:TIGR01244 family sulfur transferase [Reinekea thalattae]TXR53290.1 TIGR01244 family phosphatase [Reinekea thalattae]